MPSQTISLQQLNLHRHSHRRRLGDDVRQQRWLTPVELIKPQHLLQDELTRKIMGYWLSASEQIGRLKAHTIDDIDAYVALLAQEYETTHGGKKGQDHSIAVTATNTGIEAWMDGVPLPIANPTYDDLGPVRLPLHINAVSDAGLYAHFFQLAAVWYATSGSVPSYCQIWCLGDCHAAA